MYSTINQHRTAMISYDHRIKFVLRFTLEQNQVRDAITTYHYGGGATATGDALVAATKNIIQHGRLHKPQLVILFTDGYTNYGTPVSTAVLGLHKVADRVIVVGITRYVKMSELNMIAKDSSVIWYPDKNNLKLSIPRIMHQVCRIVHKVCPKPRHLPKRCIGDKIEYRTIVYYLWNGACAKKMRIRHKTVKCHHKFKPYYFCKNCKRYWVLKYALIHNCRCVIKTNIFRAGRCCCPKSSKTVRRKRTYKYIVTTHYHLINGKCWRRRVCRTRRCGCPDGYNKVWCVMNRYIVHWRVHYTLIKHRYCRKVIVKRIVPVICRRIDIIAMSKRCFRIYGNHKYGFDHFLKITLAYYVRDGCNCVRKVKNILVPCRCFRKKRWVWIRHCHPSCRKRCHKKKCYKVRAFLTYKLRKHMPSGKVTCVPKVIFKQKYKCCCPKRKMHTKRKCKRGQWTTQICYFKLHRGTCHKICRWTSYQVLCRHGAIRRQIKKLRDGRYKVIDWVVYKKHCRCLIMKKIKYIPWKCLKHGGLRKHCKAGILYVKARHYVLIGFHCKVQIIRIRIKVDCPHYTVFLRRRCNPHTKHFVLLYKKASQNGCKCCTVFFTKKGRPCYCRKKSVTKWKCVGHNRFRRTIFYYKMIKGRCIRQKRQETKKITTCKRRVWYSYRCIWRTGIRLVYRHVRRLVRCRCITKKTFVRRERCNCHAVNKKYSHIRRIYCDKKKNQLVTLRWIYIYDARKHICVRKTNITRKSVACNERITNHRGRCDIHSWERILTRAFYRAVNCRCRREIATTRVPCRCQATRSATVCHKDTGIQETTTRSENFDVKTDRCVRVVHIVRRPTQCQTDVRILRTRCARGSYTESLLRASRKPGTCECAEQVTRALRPCVCPTQRHVSACHGFYKTVTISIFLWNDENKECVLAHKITYKLRCRCPRLTRSVTCFKGQRITRTVSYTLRFYVCIRRERIDRQPIECSKRLRQRRSKCKRCRYNLITLAHIPLKRRCRCRWRAIFRRRCRCCPCPRSTVTITCVGFAWKVIRTTWRPVYVGSCMISCIPIVQVYYRPIVFPPRPHPHWSDCEKCVQNWVYYVLVIKNCVGNFREVVTPQTRQCCCLETPEKNIACVAGQTVTTTTTYALKNFQCVQKQIVETRDEPCPGIDSPTTRSDCDPTTCVRIIFQDSFTRDRSSCVCKRRRAALYRERCCCLRKGYTRKVCLGNCALTLTLSVTFDRSMKQCIERRSSSRSCIRCPPEKVYPGKCNSKTCHRYIYTKTCSLVDCECRCVVTRRPERCCCRTPTRFRKSCDGNVVVRTRERFVRKGDDCVPVTERRRSVVPCRTGVVIRTRAAACNPLSCKKLVVRTFERRSGCTCVRFNREASDTCCCPPKRKSLVCEKDTNVVKVIVYYDLVNGKCMRKIKKKTVRIIPRCRRLKTSTKCNRQTKRRTVYRTFFKVVKCRCVKSHVTTVSYPCVCRPPRKFVRRCRRRTCRQVVIRVWYVLEKKKCVRRRKFSQRPCCCKKKKWSVKRCNRLTGQMEISHYSPIFSRKFHRCLIFMARRSLGIEIRCFNVSPRVQEGTCDEKTGRARDLLITYHLNRHKCLCVRRVRPRIRICSCKHLGCKTVTTCQNGFTVKTTTCWVLLFGSCHPLRSVVRIPVICTANRSCTTRCDPTGCGGTERCDATTRVSCACRRASQTRRVLCCCPKASRKVKCKNPFRVVTLTGYVMNATKDKCRKYVTQKKTSVGTCPRKKRIIRGKCNPRTCRRRVCVLIYNMRKCRCVVVKKKIRAERCCCPPTKRRVSCNRITGVITRFVKYYKLFGSVCLQHQRLVQKETRCDGVTIRVTPCNPTTKQRIVYVIKYKRKHCHCKQIVKRLIQPCFCKPPTITRAPCEDGQQMRAVTYVYYELRFIADRQICVRKAITLFYEPCVCAEPVVRSACQEDANVRTVISQRMVTRLGQRVCISTVQRTSSAIRCQNRRIIRSGCQDSVRTIRTTEWRLYNCHCVRYQRSRREACDCQKRNSVRRFCKLGVKFVVSWVWRTKPGFNDCHLTRIVAASPVSCPKKKVIPLTRSCPIRKGHGFYRKYLIITYYIRNCRCRKRKRYTIRLCRCRRKFVKKRCVGDKIVRKYYSFFSQFNWCFCKMTLTVTPINCLLPRASVRMSACRRVKPNSHCVRRIDVTERRVSSCACTSARRALNQICCAPSPRTSTRCDAKNGYQVTTRTIFFLNTVGVLYNEGDVFLRDRAVRSQDIVTKTRVVCPPSSRRVTCDTRTKVKKITWTIHRRVACRCVQSTRVTTGVCQCPPSRKIRYKCKHYKMRVDTIYYVFENNECKRRVITQRERCSCPKDFTYKFCDHKTGARVTCKVVFSMTRVRKLPYFFACKKTKKCHSRRVKCPKKTLIKKECNTKTGRRVVLAVCFRLSKRKCRCVKEIKRWTEVCSCHHLNKNRTLCKNGFIVHVIKTFRLSNGHCIMKLVRSIKEVVCPAPRSVILRDCARSGPRSGRKTRVTTLSVRNPDTCRCETRIRRDLIPCICNLIPGCETKVTTRCVRNVIVTRTDFCVLVGEVCDKRWTEVRKTIQVGAGKAKAGKCKPQPNGGSAKTIYLYRTVAKKCKAVWVLIGKRKQICRCPPKRVSRKCVAPNQFIINMTRYVVHRSRTHCRSIKIRMPVFVTCRPRRIIRHKCNKKTCRRRLTVLSYRAVRCRCRRFTTRFTRTCCCPGPKRQRTYCAADGRTIVTRWTTFTLAYGKCYPVFHVTTKTMECETMAPIVRTDRVCQRNFRATRATTFVTKKCKCVPQTRITRSRCDCPARELLVRRDCIGQWATDWIFVLKFNPSTGLCDWKINRKVKRRCRCPTDTRRTRCVRQDTIEDINTSYEIQTRSNTCKKTVTRSRLPIGGCTANKLLIRVVYGSCLKENKYIQTDFYYYVIAKNCKCDVIREKKTWPCNCWEAAGQTRSLRCENQNTEIITVRGVENRGQKCVPRIFVRRRTIVCVGLQVLRGRCERSGSLVITEQRRQVKSCQCVWQTVRTTRAPCRCPGPASSLRCVADRVWRTTLTTYTLVKDVCYKKEVVTNRNVACRVGRFVTRSACSLSGSFVITVTTNTLKDCKCTKKVATRSCKCRCPRPRRSRTCLRESHRWREMNIVHKLINCVCVRIRFVRTWRFPCFSTPTKQSPCRLQPGGDGYRWYRKIVAKWQRCRCIRKLRRWRRLCSCAPRIRRTISCRKPRDRILTYTKRILRQGRCRRVIFRRVTVRIVCARPTSTKVCKNGVETVITRTPYIVNCQCRIRVTVTHAKCQCDGREILVRSSACIQCKKTLTYSRLVLVRGECVRRQRTRTEACCCPTTRSVVRRCDTRRGSVEVRTTRQVLRNGLCVPQTSVRRDIIICFSYISITIINLPSGVIISVQVYYVLIVIQCRCVRKKKTRVVGRWKCPHPIVRVMCERDRIWKQTKIYYKLKNKACIRFVKVKRIPVLCNFATSTYRPCRKVPYGWGRSVVQNWYQKRRCRCVRRVRITRFICRCRRPRVRRVCNARTGVITIYHERFVPAKSRRRCRIIARIGRRTVRCAPKWVTIEKEPCFFIQRRTVRVRCRCVVEIRRVPIRVKCAPRKVIRGRCNENICRRKIKHITYKVVECRCVRNVYYHSQICYDKKCPKSRIVRWRCVRGVKIGTLVYYKRIRCRCRRCTRLIRKRPKCNFVHKYAVSPCREGHQTFVVVRYRKRRCRCIPFGRAYRKFCSCSLRPTELIFVVASGYGGYKGFKTSVAHYIRAVIASEPISQRYVRVAIVRSCHRPLLLLNLKQSHRNLSLTVIRFLRRISFCCRRIRLGAALRTVRKRVLPQARQRTNKLVVIISQGKARISDSGRAKREAKKLKALGVKIKAIGAKCTPRKTKLLQRLVSRPRDENYSGTNSASHLLYFIDFVHSDVCPPIEE